MRLRWMNATGLAIVMLVIFGLGCAEPTARSGPATDPGQSNEVAPSTSGQQMTNTSQTIDLSSQASTVSEITKEMVYLMDDVSGQKLMDVLPISDIRNQFFGPIDWMDQLTPSQLSELRGASDKLQTLIDELQANPMAASNSTLTARLNKLDELNTRLRKAMPAE